MAAVVTRVKLSGSTDGAPIAIVATSTPGTLIHTAGPQGFDELFFKAANQTGAAVTITVEWGGTATADHSVTAFSIPANSPLIPIAMGEQISNSKSVRAFVSSASAINVIGWALLSR
jgi:hypothetical protein